MNHIGLFEGIGGFSLAARWMGWETIAWCEWNEFGQKVLKHHFPKAKAHGDITKTDFTIYRGQCDILTGGFPCQPYSLAGKRKGKEDDRHLWPEMLRAITEIQPTWVVGENVFGLVNWDGGLVFHEVQTDLEAAGYKVFPYVLPACAVNAPHRRDRVWFVAYCNNTGNATHGGRTDRNGQTESSQREHSQFKHNGIGNTGDAADTKNIRRENALENGELEGRRFRQSYKRYAWDSFPSVSPICSGDDGLSNRLDSITFPKWRNESIKAAGNAIVPQVAYQIFKTIKLYNETV